MKKEFSWSQSRVETIPHESLGVGFNTMSFEMWQSSILKTVGNSVSYGNLKKIIIIMALLKKHFFLCMCNEKIKELLLPHHLQLVAPHKQSFGIC